MNVQTGGAGSGGIDPFTFVKAAIEAVPAVKYALGVGGIAGVIALVAGFMDLRIALVGIPIALTFMVVLVLFARLATGAPGMQWLISILVVCLIIIFLFGLFLFGITFFVREDVLHGWGLNSFYELFGVAAPQPPPS